MNSAPMTPPALCWRRASRWRVRAGDAFRAGHALNSLGDLARCKQDYSAAKTAYEESVALLREVGAQRDLASALGNFGHACLHLGDVERAHALFGESMAAHQAQQNEPGMAESLVGFAATAIARGLPAAGVRLLAAAAATSEQHVTSAWPATRTEYAHYLALARAGLTEAEFRGGRSDGTRPIPRTGSRLRVESAAQIRRNTGEQDRAGRAGRADRAGARSHRAHCSRQVERRDCR